MGNDGKRTIAESFRRDWDNNRDYRAHHFSSRYRVNRECAIIFLQEYSHSFFCQMNIGCGER